MVYCLMVDTSAGKSYFEPIYKKINPMTINAKSKILVLMFFSLKIKTPPQKLTNTLLRRIIDTMEIIAQG